MLQNSLIFGTLYTILGNLYRAYLNSDIYRLWKRLAACCAAALNGSVIVSFFRSDWDCALRVQRLTTPICRLLDKLRAWTAGESAFAKKLQQSTILSLLDERSVFFFLCAAAFSLPFLPTLVLLLMILVSFALYLLNIFLNRLTVGPMGLAGIAAILFALCYTVAALRSPTFPASLEEMLMFIGLMTAMPVAASVLQDEHRRNVFLTILLLSSALVSLYGLYQYVTGVAIDKAWVDSESFENLKTRAYATFGNPNVMGEYLIATCSIGVGMFWKERNALLKIFYMGLTGIAALGLLATGSRASLLGLAFSAMIFALVAEQRLIPFGIAAVAAIPFVLPDDLLYRFTAALTLKDTSTQYRMSIYSACFDMLQDYWTVGIGVGAFAVVYPRYLFAASNSYHAHNLFLQVFLELGILGFSVFILFMIFWLQRLYRSIVADSGKGSRFLTATIMSGMLGLLVQGMFDHLWFNYRIVFLFWLLCGIGLACAPQSRRTAQ